MWSYDQLSSHRFLEPPIGSGSIGNRSYFLEKNPQIFFLPKLCPYCGSACQILGNKDQLRKEENKDVGLVWCTDIAQLLVCQTCGWWTIPILLYSDDIFEELMSLSAGQVRGELKLFSSEADDIPMDDLHRYLLAHYEHRNALSPYKVEDAVGQMFKESGYYVVATARSNDGGIDLFILQKDDAHEKAVQIKRTKNKVGVELIRSFAGALLLEGLTRGVFVTTSDFTINARLAADRFHRERGYRIELVDSSKLFAAIKVKRRDKYTSADDPTAPFSRVWRDPSKYVTTTIDAMYRIQV
jgi:restriction system protein